MLISGLKGLNEWMHSYSVMACKCKMSGIQVSVRKDLIMNIPLLSCRKHCHLCANSYIYILKFIKQKK